MRLLIDTHVALWCVTGDAALGAKGLSLLTDPANEIVVSVAAVWEVAIKHGQLRNGTSRMPVSPARFVQLVEQTGFELMPISVDHAVAVGDLPPVHGDPFDRMMVAQALVSATPLVTRDAKLASYPIQLIDL